MVSSVLPDSLLRRIMGDYVEVFRTDESASIIPAMTSCKAIHDATLPSLYKHIYVRNGRPVHLLRQTDFRNFRYTSLLVFLPCCGIPKLCRRYCLPCRDDAKFYAHFGTWLTEPYGKAKEPVYCEVKEDDVRVPLHTLWFQTQYSWRHAWTRPVFRIKRVIYWPVPSACLADDRIDTPWAMMTQSIPDYDPFICQIDISQPIHSLYQDLLRRKISLEGFDYESLAERFTWHLPFTAQAAMNQRWLDRVRLRKPIYVTCKARPWLLAEHNDQWKQIYDQADDHFRGDEEMRRVDSFSIFHFVGEVEAYGPTELRDLILASYLYIIWVHHMFQQPFTWRPTPAIEPFPDCLDPHALSHRHLDPVITKLSLPGDDSRFAQRLMTDFLGIANSGRIPPLGSWFSGGEYGVKTPPRHMQRRHPIEYD